MKKFAYHNCAKKANADVVLVGVPDESGNKSNRHGASKGPLAIRKASHERLSFKRKGKTMRILPERGSLNLSFHDYGNSTKKQVSRVLSSVKKHQIPIILGGDHSITTKVLQGFSPHFPKMAVLYFDAHPDIVSSTENYYGSVVHDICKLPSNSPRHVVQLGLRSIEEEERINLKKNKISHFTALDVAEIGLKKVFSKIRRKIGKMPLYISIDLDSIDPSFAPAVDTPVPFGLLSNDVLSLVKRCAVELNVVGLDIMEMSPRHDIQMRTAQLAAQLIVEFIGSKKFSK